MYIFRIVFVAAVIVTSLLAATLVAAAIRKLSHRSDVVRSYARVGVPEARLNYLAVILLAGAAGLVGGLFWAPIGLAAGAGVVVYFLLAIAAHVRTGDEEHLLTPLLIEVFALAAVALRLSSV